MTAQGVSSPAGSSGGRGVQSALSSLGRPQTSSVLTTWFVQVAEVCEVLLALEQRRVLERRQELVRGRQRLGRRLDGRLLSDHKQDEMSAVIIALTRTEEFVLYVLFPSRRRR